jgi:hypothetical protein
MSTVTDEQAVDLTALAAGDRKVARTLAGAQTQRMAGAQRVAEQDAAADRQLRIDEGRLRLVEQRDQVRANRRARRVEQREQRRAARRQARAQRWARLAARAGAGVRYARDNAAGVYSSLIYGLAVGGAVYGQITAATGHGLPAPVGVVAAVAIEGIGLSMAATGLQLRLAGERAIVPRVLVWAATAGAFCINLFGHGGWLGWLLATLSALGITVWEVRSAAKHRLVLRKLGMLPEPPARFGWRRWVAAPGPTWRAWRLDARERVTAEAAELIERAAAVDAQRVAYEADQRAEQERAKVREQVAKAARQTARRAARKGDAGAALAVLMRLAADGVPPVQPQLPAAAPVDPDVQELCEMVRRQAAGARVRLLGSTPSTAGRRPYTPAHPRPVTPAPPTRPASPPVTPPSEPKPEPEPGTRPTRPDPGAKKAGRASAAAAAGVRRRVTVSARADEAELERAFRELVTELGREPSGTELATRAGVGKSTANRFKQNRKEA